MDLEVVVAAVASTLVVGGRGWPRGGGGGGGTGVLLAGYSGQMEVSEEEDVGEWAL